MAILKSLVFALVSSSALAVTVIPSSLSLPKQYEGSKPVSSERDLLFLGGPNGLAVNATWTHILISSHQNLKTSDNIHSSADSFVRGAIDAWGQHQHFIIRPEDVWFTILVQLNFFMTKHGDDKDVRDKFVNFKGKQKIFITGFSLYTVLGGFQFEIQKRVKTDWLLDWIQPRFSTSSEHDNMMGNVLMMGLMKSYFEYYGSIICGIPSITLLGTQQDWKRLLEKLDRLSEFGKEPTEYGRNLRPVLSRFVKTFEAPEDPDIRQFWSNIVSAERPPPFCGSPRYLVTGWINGFHHWNSQGSRLSGNEPLTGNPTVSGSSVILDGILYAKRPIKDLPSGHATVPINIKLDGERDFSPAELVVGMMGKNITKGIPHGYDEAMQKVNFSLPASATNQHGILQPASAWFLYRQDANRVEPEAIEIGREDLEHSMGKGWSMGSCSKQAVLGRVDGSF
jgi:hypothetical protein